MRILGLWVSDYYSGSTDERFIKPLQSLGHEVDVFPLEDSGVESRVIGAFREKNYDMLIHVPHYGAFRPEIMEYITNQTKVVTIAWNGDEWLWDTKPDYHKKMALAHNFCISTDVEYAGRYYESGQKNVLFSSWGYSGSDWKHSKRKRDIDVYFCGSKTPERDLFLKALLDNRIKVVIDGPGYEHHAGMRLNKHSGGKIPLKEMIRRYSMAKIGINFVSGSKGDYQYTQVKARNFEIPAVGTFQLSEYSPKLERVFRVGKELDCFDSASDLVGKVKFYLDNESKRNEIAALGHERNKEYSYENIFKKVIGRIRETAKNLPMLDA